MTRVTFKVLFFIKKKKTLKNEQAPIYVRITVNGQRAEFAAQRSIKANQWDSKKCCALGYAKQATELNSYLEFIKSQLQVHKVDLAERGKPIDAKSLKNAYLGIDENKKTILQVFKNTMNVVKDWSISILLQQLTRDMRPHTGMLSDSSVLSTKKRILNCMKSLPVL